MIYIWWISSRRRLTTYGKVNYRVLKDVPSIPLEMMRTKEQDHVRLGLFPILDYKGLYHVVVQLVDVIPLIQQGVHGNMNYHDNYSHRGTHC